MLKRLFKTELLAAAFMLAALGFTSCNNAGNGDRGADDPDYTSYRDYVSTTRTDTTYYSRSWEELERDYNERKAKVDAKKDQLDDSARAEYNRMEAEWNDFKVRYDQRRAERERANNPDRVTVIRTTFVFPDPADYRYANLPAESVGQAYQRFFDGLKGDISSYSKEDWQEIDQIYEALETRRKNIEEQIPGKDKDMINTIKKQYGSLMTTNRPFAEYENK